MTPEQRIKKVEQSMTLQQVLHTAALEMLAALAKAQAAYKAAGGEWDEGEKQKAAIFQLLEIDE